MLIDWFTVGAQALNFIILVALMKHFLYKPVLDAIDAREKRIADELADADKKKADAQKDGDDFRQKSAAFDKQRADLLSKATADAQAQRDTLLAAAHKAADDIAAKRQEALVSDARNLNKALLQRTQTEVFAVARQALSDLATVNLEASACEVFISRLRALDGSAKADLAKALQSPTGSALVRSAFELPTVQRTAVHKAINDTFAMQVELRYETAPELVGGIELSAHGQKFAWSISDYLASLEHGVDELLKDAAPASSTPPAPAPPAPADTPAAVADTKPAATAKSA
jgi:F-type H+-transporting ATPase subunit b